MSSITISSQIPVGSIMPIASNLTGSYSIPSSGTVDSLGWMYCDGSAIPSGNTLSGNTPNLTDDRFLMGSSSPGTTGGANSITLTTAQLPSHTHGAGSYATNTGTSVASSSHTHGVGSLNPKLYITGTAIIAKIQSSVSTWTASTQANASSSVGNTNTYTNAVEMQGNTAAPAGTTSLNNISIDGTSSSTGSGSSIDNRPSYFACQYIIKVS